MDPSVNLALTPLLLLPGVGILVLSTSARYSRLHDELHTIVDRHADDADHWIAHLSVRAHLFRNALVCFYVSIALLALSALVSGVELLSGAGAAQASVALIALAVLGIEIAAMTLVRESWLSLEIIESHNSHRK